MSSAQQFIEEWRLARQEAEALLRALVQIRGETERRLRETGQVDAMRSVTGRSSIDNAIASTERMIQTFDRLIDEAQRVGGAEDLSWLDESDGSRGRSNA